MNRLQFVQSQEFHVLFCLQNQIALKSHIKHKKEHIISGRGWQNLMYIWHGTANCKNRMKRQLKGHISQELHGLTTWKFEHKFEKTFLSQFVLFIGASTLFWGILITSIFYTPPPSGSYYGMSCVVRRSVPLSVRQHMAFYRSNHLMDWVQFHRYYSSSAPNSWHC